MRLEAAGSPLTTRNFSCLRHLTAGSSTPAGQPRGPKSEHYSVTPARSVEPDPRTPDLYVATYSGAVTSKLRSAYPEGLQCARFQFQQDRTLKKHCLYYNVTEYPPWHRENGHNPWVHKGWVRIARSDKGTFLSGQGQAVKCKTLSPKP